ncbi:uncharacterized protein N7482_006784 [Penicillium canariense]|uniref:Uncharacterized protein n=1 Tax=Penicillium canariense TaxID=189055 RepID=A0A9W9HXZ9_9EURO|nr:uncharacterized protein N7482_006784 [Penicillium canariense]KAJ5159780.1 hypothetical protein N7482_006784 [Penicillium canariense]
MFSNRSGLAVSLLSLLQGSSAAFNPVGGPITGDITKYETTVPGNPSATVIFADIVAPSGSTVVVDFASSTEPGISSTRTNTPSIPPCLGDPCTVTLTPVRFAPSVETWIQHLRTTVTVPESSTPVLHFHAIEYGQATYGQSSTTPASPPAAHTTAPAKKPSRTQIPRSSQRPSQLSPSGTPRSETTPSDTAQGSGSNTPPSSQVGSSPSTAPAGSIPLVKGTTKSGQSDTPSPGNPAKTPPTSPTDNTSGSPTPSNPNLSAANTAGQSKTNIGQSSSSQSAASGTHTSGTNASVSPTATSITPSTTSGPSQTTTTPKSDDASTSVTLSLGDSPDSQEMVSMLSTLTGTSSAEIAALLSAEQTEAAATTEAWDDLMSEMPTETITATGAAQATEGVTVAGWLGKLSNNVQNADLKDKNTWNQVHGNLRKAQERISDYVEHRKSSSSSGGGSSDGSCSSGGGILSIFKAASCFVDKATNEIKRGSKNIGNLINSGWDLTKQGISEIKDEMPALEKMTSETEQQFKNNIRNFSEITEALEELEEKEKEEEEKATQSESATATDSTTSTSTGTQTTTTSTTTTTAASSSEITCSPECTACSSAANLAASLKKRRSQHEDSNSFKKRHLDPLNGFENTLEYVEEAVKKSGTTIVEHKANGKLTSSRYMKFDQAAGRLYVQDLVGCTAVAIVSEMGAWLGHFWESPTMMAENYPDTFKDQATNAIKSGDPEEDGTPAAYPLGDAGNILDPANNAQIFIMTPQKDGKMMYPTTVGWLEDVLTGESSKWPGVQITKHLYDKPPPVDYSGVDEIEDLREREAEKQKRENEVLFKYNKNGDSKGRVLVEFDPYQNINPEDAYDPDDQDPPKAIWRVLMENDEHLEQWCPRQNQQNGKNQKRAAACRLTSISSTGTTTDASTTSTGMISAASTTPSGTNTVASTTATTTSAMCDLEVYDSTYSVCSCSSTNSGHTLKHAIAKPSGTKCSDIKTFPMTSFIQVATAVPTSAICANVQKDLNGNEGAFCQCSTTSNKEVLVTLPYAMGSLTVLDQCAEITEWPSNTVPYTTAAQTQPTVTVTDYTSTDIGNGNVFVFTAGKEYYDYTKYGDPSATGPITKTTGLGDPIKEIVYDYTSTNEGGTMYAYAEATGDGDGNVAPVGSPTATSVPAPTENCVKFVVVDKDLQKYGSKYDQFLFTFWGIENWADSTDIERDIEAVLKDNGVTKSISIEANTGRWGTVAMWNNGDEENLTSEVVDGLMGLGAARPNCKLIPKTSSDQYFQVKDSAPEEMDYIYDNYPKYISSP